MEGHLLRRGTAVTDKCRHGFEPVICRYCKKAASLVRRHRSWSPAPEETPERRHLDELERCESWVYFIRIGNRIKIGYSINPERRARELGQAKLIHCVPGGRIEEQRLHLKFAHLRDHGEWFCDDPELVDYIDGLPGRPLFDPGLLFGPDRVPVTDCREGAPL